MNKCDEPQPSDSVKNLPHDGYSNYRIHRREKTKEKHS